MTRMGLFFFSKLNCKKRTLKLKEVINFIYLLENINIWTNDQF
jgi:hypothetical protein